MSENYMQKMIREKTRQQHKEATQAFVKKGYNLKQYIQMMEMVGGPKDAEEYTEICEDFLEPIYESFEAHKNLVYVDPIKYKINESQYMRIFKTPLAIEGRLFSLVKPVEHKLSKKTYYELAKIAVIADHYLARSNIDDTAGPVYARQMELVNPDFLEPGKYKEICIYAAKANYRALKWMRLDKLSTQDFIDIFMAAATHWYIHEWRAMNPAVFYLLDGNCPDRLRKKCYVAYAEKYGIEELQGDYERYTKGTKVHPNEFDYGMLNEVGYTLGNQVKQKSQERRFTVTPNDKLDWFEVNCNCEADLKDCPAYKYLKIKSGEIIDWDAKRVDNNDCLVPQKRIDARLPNGSDLDAHKLALKNICSSCKLGRAK